MIVAKTFRLVEAADASALPRWGRPFAESSSQSHERRGIHEQRTLRRASSFDEIGKFSALSPTENGAVLEVWQLVLT